jgi:hypothetical protein
MAYSFSSSQIAAIKQAVNDGLTEKVQALLTNSSSGFGYSASALDSQKLAALSGRLSGLQSTTITDADIIRLFEIDDLELILKQKSAVQSLYAAAYKNTPSQPRIIAIEDLFKAAQPLFAAFPNECAALALKYPQNSDAFNTLTYY